MRPTVKHTSLSFYLIFASFGHFMLQTWSCYVADRCSGGPVPPELGHRTHFHTKATGLHCAILGAILYATSILNNIVRDVGFSHSPTSHSEVWATWGCSVDSGLVLPSFQTAHLNFQTLINNYKKGSRECCTGEKSRTMIMINSYDTYKEFGGQSVSNRI